MTDSKIIDFTAERAKRRRIDVEFGPDELMQFVVNDQHLSERLEKFFEWRSRHYEGTKLHGLGNFDEFAFYLVNSINMPVLGTKDQLFAWFRNLDVHSKAKVKMACHHTDRLRKAVHEAYKPLTEIIYHARPVTRDSHAYQLIEQLTNERDIDENIVVCLVMLKDPLIGVIDE